jgi:hypothetical protein
MKSKSKHPNPRRRVAAQRPARVSKPPAAAGLEERILDLIAAAAGECKKIEAEFGKNPPPQLETLINLHRVIVLHLCDAPDRSQKTLELITRLMRPVMEYARIEEVRRQRELAEQKYRDQAAAEQAARAQEQRAAEGGDTLTPETVEKIEHELKLL